ncbi:MAG TPA: hypothetical protein VFC07_08630, partial [Verrucomicrobiae bacterium]|nr:hypothetical protein [Verrucomicrobiae bacterium]
CSFLTQRAQFNTIPPVLSNDYKFWRAAKSAFSRKMLRFCRALRPNDKRKQHGTCGRNAKCYYKERDDCIS